MTRATLIGMARVQIALGKAEGHPLDKKITRYNDIAEQAIRYAQCASPDVLDRLDLAIAGMLEAADACFKDSPLYTGDLDLVPAWYLP